MRRRPCVLVSAAIIAAVLADAAAAQQAPVVRSGTQLVRVVVLARDRKGKPVVGLKAGDFTIAEDGRPQNIAFFEARGAAAPTTPPESIPEPRVPSAAHGTSFSNSAGVDRVRNVTVVLLDRLNTVWADQAQAREGVRQFLSQVRPDDRVALYALDGPALRVLHDFTADTAALLKSLTGAARMTSTSTEAQNSTAEPVLGPDLRTDGSTEYQLQSAGTAAHTTITALQTIGQHLAAVPGRKSVVWISSGFPIDPQRPPPGAINWTSEIQRATRALNTAGISVYPVDARGLMGAFSDPGTAVRPPTFATLSTFHANTEIMRSLADDTGGRVFTNTNDISGAIRAAIDDADAYYVLGYYAPSQDGGKYRQIDVKTHDPDLTLRYRRGYIAVPGDLGDRKTSLERAVRDVLDATGIPITVNVTPGGGNEETELAIAADGRALALRNSQGSWTGSIDLVIAQVHADGTLHLDTDTTIALTLTDAQHDAIIESGLTLTRHITVAGNTLRVAIVIRDSSSGAIGSVFVPAARLRPSPPR